MDETIRRGHLKNNPNFLLHEAFGCLLLDGQVLRFATLLRVEEPLMNDIPVVTLMMPGPGSLESVLRSFHDTNNLQFVLLSTPSSAYEPILRCL